MRNLICFAAGLVIGGLGGVAAVVIALEAESSRRRRP